MRRLLAFLLVVAAGAVAAAAVLYLVVFDSGSDELAVGVNFHPFTSSPGNESCIPAVDGGSGPPNSCDPINLVFDGVALDVAVGAFIDAGWTTIGFGSTQLLFFDDEQRLRPQNVQLFLQNSLDERFHMRLWGAADPGGNVVIIGAVHHERGFINHAIDRDWEAAERRVRDDLCEDGPFRCRGNSTLKEQLEIQGDDTEWRGWTNDGKPALISRPGKPDAVTE